MTDDIESAESSEISEAPIARDTLIGYVSGALSVLTVLIYPLGVSKAWLQLYIDYTGVSGVTWYAATLLPVSMTVGQALWLALWAIVTNSLALSLILAGRLGRAQTIYKFSTSPPAEGSKRVTIFRGEVQGVPEAYVSGNLLLQLRGMRGFVYVSSMVVLVIEIILLPIRYGDYGLDNLFLALFLACSIGGAVWAAHLVTTKPHAVATLDKPGDLMNPARDFDEIAERKANEAEAAISAELKRRFMRSFRRWLSLGLVIDFAGVALAMMCLAVATGLDLPEAAIEQEGKKDEVITLLAFSNGQWQGFRSSCYSECELVAIPDNDQVQANIRAQHVPASMSEEGPTILSSTSRFLIGLALVALFLLSFRLYTDRDRPTLRPQENS